MGFLGAVRPLAVKVARSVIASAAGGRVSYSMTSAARPRGFFEGLAFVHENAAEPWRRKRSRRFASISSSVTRRYESPKTIKRPPKSVILSDTLCARLTSATAGAQQSSQRPVVLVPVSAVTKDLPSLRLCFGNSQKRSVDPAPVSLVSQFFCSS